MYTNIITHGGDFRNALDHHFAVSSNVNIASGYTSLDILHAYEDDFYRIADNGGVSKLLLGMAFYEGLSKKKLHTVNRINESLAQYDNSSGVYVTNGRRYHGKVYHFYDAASSNIFVGSSNFSTSGTRGNIECTVPVIAEAQKQSVINFLEDLYSPSYSVQINRAEISVPGQKVVISRNIQAYWSRLVRYDPHSLDTSTCPRFDYPLLRIAEKEKSNLNVYFGKGRFNRATGKIIPRPWYEAELIADRTLSSMEFYPKGDFLAYTDDGFIIPMRTQGDYYKNIRSKQSLQIFGMWIKGKLERAGALNMYEPVTLDSLAEYGNDRITFYRMATNKYYMEF